MQPPDEEALIERARREPDAFAMLYQRYLARVYRYLYLRLSSQHDAKDLTSQVINRRSYGTSGTRSIEPDKVTYAGYFSHPP